MQNSVPNPAMLISDVAAQLFFEEEEARGAKLSGKPRGPVTGFSALDEALGGFLSPGLHTILAAPGAGKTALTLQIAAQCRTPALFVSAEMRPVDLFRRIVARVNGRYLGHLRGGMMTPEQLRREIEKTVTVIPRLAMLDAVGQRVDPSHMQEQADLLRERFDSPHVLIVLDSLTDWVGSVKDGSEYEVTEHGLNAMKLLSSSLKCPILTIVHRNRTSNRASGNTDQLHGGKGSGRIEYISESVWNLTPDAAENAISDTRRVTLELVKNRNGKRGECLEFQFEGRLSEFREL